MNSKKPSLEELREEIIKESNWGKPFVLIDSDLTTEQREEFQQRLLKDIRESPMIIMEPEVNKTEVMSVFNELLSEWYEAKEELIHERSGSITNDRIELAGKEDEYKRRFKEALGVSDHGE